MIIYYSFEGNTAYVADKIAEYVEADILRLEPVKEYPRGSVRKYLWGGKSVMFGEMPKLKAYEWNKDKYDTIIIGTPVWASSFTPPIKTFLKENKLSDKKMALFACHAGGGTNKCFEKLKQELGVKEVVETLSLVNPKDKVSEENTKKIKEFCEKV